VSRRMVRRLDWADLSSWASSSASVRRPFLPRFPPLPFFFRELTATEPIVVGEWNGMVRLGLGR